MPRQVSVSIQPSGRQLPIADVSAVRLYQELHTHHTFEIVVPFDQIEGSKASFMQTAHQELVGQSIAISWQQNAFDYGLGRSYDFAFTGVVTDLVMGSSNDYTGNFVIKGYSPTCLLTDGVQKRTFRNLPLATIVEQVLQPYPANVLQVQKNALRHTAPVPYVVQYNESSFDFLNRLLASYNEWFFFDGVQLHVGQPAEDKTVELFMDGYWSNFQLEAAVRPARLSLYAYDPAQHQHWRESNSAQVEGVGTNQYAQFAVQTAHQLFTQPSHAPAARPVQSQGDLQEATRQAGSAGATTALTFRGRSDNPGLQLGTLIDVTAEGLGSGVSHPDSLGKYRIVSISHEVDQAGNYQNIFAAILHSATVPPTNPYAGVPAAQPELAEVIDWQDPKRLGRVRVRYYWPTARPQEAESDWLRVSTPYSGDGKGQLFTPEIGSQVLIGYEHNRADTPVVLGNVFHPNNKQNAQYSNPQNNLKGMQTAGGNKFVMTDTAGEQKILISNSNNKGTAIEVGFRGDGSITIKSNGPISILAGGDITMQSGQNITLTAKKNITLTAQEESLTATAKQNVRLTAEEQATLDAKGITVSSGEATSLHAGGTMTLKATSVTDISGSEVEINQA